MKSAIGWIVLGGLLGSINVAAASQGLDDPPTRVVHYSDLDLARQEGVVMLYSRIRYAAHQVCEPLAQLASPSIFEVNQCMSTAIEHAVADVGAPLLTDYYRTVTFSQQR